MKKQSLAIFAGQLLFAGALTLIAPQVEYSQKAPTPVKVTNTSSEPVPVNGTVNIGNTLQIRPAIPEQAFSKTWDLGYPSTGTQIVSRDSAGTNYAITSFTVTNYGSVTSGGSLNGWFGDRLTDDNCYNPDNATPVLGPVVYVPPGQTIHVTFPQPFVLRAMPGANSCLTIRGLNMLVSVVGYRF